MAIYCLHDDILKLNNKYINDNDILTFDDGHYSVYKHRNLLKRFNCKKILFITPSYISLNKRDNEPDLTIYYQYDYRINHHSQWLNIYEIEELINNYDFELGMHSYYHDFVYVQHQKNDNDKIWRMYKLSNDIKKMKIFNNIYGIKSKLAIQGLDVTNGYLYKRNQTQFEEFIKSDTFLCISWFKKYFYVPNKYAYPFFDESIELKSELFYYGIKNIFGHRKSINEAITIK